MDDRLINVFVTSFPGIGLPSTLVLPIASSSSIQDLFEALADRVPDNLPRLILTTLSNRQLNPHSDDTLTQYVGHDSHDFFSVRLCPALCGGKGGFGSQLRAAGGRMSSRKKRDQNATGSNRNLDGRRLRTVQEAKALAEYLELKPEMDRREREKRTQRWKAVVEAAERREEEIRNGSQGRLDGRWVEDREEISDRIREATEGAMSTEADADKESIQPGEEPASQHVKHTSTRKKAVALHGFDEQMTDSSEDSSVDEDK